MQININTVFAFSCEHSVFLQRYLENVIALWIHISCNGCDESGGIFTKMLIICDKTNLAIQWNITLQPENT
jgi:hypothetical protein